MNEQKMIEKIAITFKKSIDEVNLETMIKEDLKKDSLDLVEMIMDLEDEYNIKITDEEAMKIKTIKDLVEVLKNHGL